MTDQRPPADFDDELLSAYLDDELSADQRARVEDRLAADPAARQTVEQLRAVSRAVQGLPRQTLGEDLRGAVLQRAERAMLAPAPVRRSPDDAEPLPRFTIGRSVRGWIWAGMAVAAALLITVFQPERKQDENLPHVAVAHREAEPAARRLARGIPEMHALPERPAPAAPPAEAAARGSLASAEPAAPPASAAMPASPPVTSPTAGNRPTAHNGVGDQLGLARELPADRLTGAGAAAIGGAAAEQPPRASPLAVVKEMSRPASDVLVVHVNVRPAALRSQAFDRLLVSNGITIERPPVDQKLTTSGAAPAGAAGMVRVGADSAAATATQENVDAVLVEAPASQIEHCLADLDADKDTYLGVAIDQASADQRLPAGKLAAQRNWQQYNRGQVPQQQRVEIAPNANVFDEALARSDYGGVGGRAAEGAQPSLDKSGQVSPANGRAMRMQAQQLDGRQLIQQLRSHELAAGENVAEDSLGKRSVRLRDNADRENSPGTLQVLFVLRSEPTPSPAADDRVP
jgi:hypothetical protein